MSVGQCKRLIEVDLPIKVVSEHARHEQNVKKGHLHGMHVWWATRPLATCRSALLGALLPDPADPNCPENFRKRAWELLRPLQMKSEGDGIVLRNTLLDFIGDFSSWENSTNKMMSDTARELVKAAYPDALPLVVDPFAGMGSIPFEALRLGTDVFASDLNPVAVLLLKTTLEYIPTYGERLAKAVERWGAWVREQVTKELKEFYPESNGSAPLAYIWARTILCEGPNCGAELPLVGLLMLSHKPKNLVALRYRGDKIRKQVIFDLFRPKSEEDIQRGIVQRFSATCPIPSCGYTTPYKRVREQLRAKKGGTLDSRLIAVITLKPDGSRTFRLAAEQDLRAVRLATKRLEQIQRQSGSLPMIPNEPSPQARGPGASRAFSLHKYGMTTWGDLFTPRQILALNTFAHAVSEAHQQILKETGDKEFARAVTTCLSLAVSGTLAPYQSALSFYSSDHMRSIFMQGMAIPMRPDFAEANPLMPDLVGGFGYALEQLVQVLERESKIEYRLGTVRQGPAARIPLPDGSVPLVATDPPYYDAVPYADLSDFCYVWLKRMLAKLHPDLFSSHLTPKSEECIMDPGPPRAGESEKDRTFFEECIQRAFEECKRVLRPDGVAVVLFAHKGTAGWEALLKALIEAGWTVTASWPIATERGARMRARNSAVLASSVFLVCRPRLDTELVGDWREVLSELQPRMHSWMQRLVKENIVGADAIFACIGPALEIYSRYDTVETAGGKKIELADKYGQNGELTEKGYLSYVWESVAREALNTIFEGADPTGFEQDSRLTAMWLWTLHTESNGINKKGSGEIEAGEKNAKKANGYALEYDVARKISQGLGTHLEELSRHDGIVEIEGNMATLLFVSERREALFGKRESEPRKITKGQTTLLGEPVSVIEATSEALETGKTSLDRLHQAMLLFGDGRSEALKRFLVEEGVGRDDRFWRLANALSALYPRSSEEKRWVDGVLSRKKVLGF